MASRGGLAEALRRFGEDAGTSPLQARVALALSGSAEALRALEAVRARQPAGVLAALHDLALAGGAPALAAAHAEGDGEAAAAAAVDAVLLSADALAVRRPVRTVEATRCAVLYPAVAEAARRAGADAVGLVDVGSPALNPHLDRLGIAYDTGQVVGDPASPVRLSASVVGGRPVPSTAVPEVVARVAVDPDPVDVSDPDDVRWLRACVPPDRPERAAQLAAELALVAADPPQLVRGDAVDVLPDAVARVPGGALPVVTTTWALSRYPLQSRLRFLHRLDEVAAHRAVAWVSVEGVGVAPAVPTLGDRRASGHSTVGVTVLDGAVVRAEAVGRCWSRGRLLSWLAEVPRSDGEAHVTAG
ncbi:hypothetical protein SAMN05660690_2550 [Geodermatophilus telluris]|uniref:DUF2332 domain-containing protein n=1 Tax=Geodermatophilus telluris TaxID=1190417 RepID=A0A1G6PH67_9ACTN|nr:DUF2332 domain-containing protein [Geodermatophilus telluris]SDC78695.1 hypothetical protein SAMN05660690_2550 [Geodermatophilus telluris]